MIANYLGFCAGAACTPREFVVVGFVVVVGFEDAVVVVDLDVVVDECGVGFTSVSCFGFEVELSEG